MREGKVKWFNPTKGFGFIIPAEGGADVFVHMTDLKKSGLRGLADGQQVRFVDKIDERNGKRVASEIEVVDGQAS